MMFHCCNIYHLVFPIQAAPAAIWKSMGNEYGKEIIKDFNLYGSSMR